MGESSHVQDVAMHVAPKPQQDMTGIDQCPERKAGLLLLASKKSLVPVWWSMQWQADADDGAGQPEEDPARRHILLDQPELRQEPTANLEEAKTEAEEAESTDLQAEWALRIRCASWIMSSEYSCPAG